MTVTVALAPPPIQQYFNNAGQPNVGGSILTQVGGVNYPTYEDSSGNTALPNPIPLNSRGEISNASGASCQLFLVADVTYTFTQYDSGGNQINQSISVACSPSYAELSSSSGASLFGEIASGTGAVERTVQEKLDDIVSRSDYNSDLNFTNAVGTKPNIDGSGNFDAKLTPTGESQQNLSEIIDTVIARQNATHAGRYVVTYRGPYSIFLRGGDYTALSGFRFLGQWSRSGKRVVTMPTTRVAAVEEDAGVSPNLGAGLSAPTFENWYAAFLCANSDDTIGTIQVMPFLRVGTVSSSTITLNKAGEGIHTVEAQSYAWADNVLANTDCLVISETESVGTRANAFSGRVTSFTANTSTTVTLDTIGSVDTLDWLLPAPPGYTDYCYLGSFYLDSAEVRNIADSGSLVKSYGIAINSPAFTASVPTPVLYTPAGYICPLATAVNIYSNATLSTSSTGDYVEFYGIDDTHVVDNIYVVKQGTVSLGYVDDHVMVPFSFGQQFYFSNDGSLVLTRVSGQLRPLGWIEP